MSANQQKLNATRNSVCVARGNHMKKLCDFRPNRLRLAVTAALLGSVFAAPVMAYEFDFDDVKASIDTTLSYGIAFRTQNAADSLIGKANLAGHSLPSDFGDFVAARDLPGRFSVNSDDGDLLYPNSGDVISNVVKATTEMQMEYQNMGFFVRANAFYDFRNQTRFGGEAQDLVGTDITLLDAYVFADFDLGGHATSIRLGRQVVSWGESTFIQGGINIINAVDVSKLRIAGAELKEAFLPQDMFWASFDLSENLTLETLYMFEFEEILPDPAGSFFSTNDAATPGANRLLLNFGLLDDDLLPDGSLPPGAVPRTQTREARDRGQFGFALRWFVPDLNFTEFGFYFLRYHSRLPLVSGTSVTSSEPTSIRYFTEFPNDINLWGLSWNSNIGTWAFAGELSYRPNAPIQIDPVEVIFAALSPLNSLIPQPFLHFNSQLGQFGPGQEVRGFDRSSETQFQFTITKLFGPANPFGGDEWVVLGEFGFNNYGDLPGNSVLRFAGSGTDTGGGFDVTTGAGRNPVTQTEGFATAFSWGYRLLTRVDYNSAFGTSWTLTPQIAFNHDVQGTTPGPGGSFIENRKSVTASLTGDYLATWRVGLSYTTFFGGGDFNLLRDRDFASFNVSYAF